MRKPGLSESQVISAIRAVARRLRRTPTRSEFARLARIHHMKVHRLFGGYRAAVRAAGLEPDRGGLRIDAAAMLEDWGRLARKLQRHPTRDEYEKLGRYASASLETRFHRWSNVREHFLEFVERNGAYEQWRDVVESLKTGPIPRRGGGKSWLTARKAKPETLPRMSADDRGSEANAANPTILPPLRGKRCVTQSMLWILFEDNRKASQDAGVMVTHDRGSGLPEHRNPIQSSQAENALVKREGSAAELSLYFPKRVLPGRPLMGQRLDLNGLGHEPVNEMGVVFLFGMVAHLLGFEVEALQTSFPDCLAKLEVEPGRWQHVRIEFEFESRKFREHRHDPAQCDMIVCWRHNWRECPAHIQVLELGKLVTREPHPR